MPKHDDGGTYVFGAGVYDSGLFGGNNDAAASFSLEYRYGYDIALGIKPWLGGFVTTDGTVYGAAGLFRDFEVLPNVYITPQAGVGAWYQGDADKDLGHVLEFRTGVEATYRFENGSRIGVAFYHLSNASISDDNPGQESIMATYVLPLGEMRKLGDIFK